MRVILQRVSSAAVEADGETTGSISRGLVALVGVGVSSTDHDAQWLARKTGSLRVFSDEHGRMNRSVTDVSGSVLAVSQFTLYGDARKGNRPSFIRAADPSEGERLYEAYCQALAVPVERGVFGADMRIDFCADGPVTVTLESETGGSSA